jgi:hypothetical protein
MNRNSLFHSWRGMLVFGLVQAVSMMVGSALAATNYVAETGSDTNTGASWASPYRSISNAVAKAAANDLILVSNGTYTITAAINPSKVLTIKSVNGPDMTFINGNYPATSNSFIFMGNDSVVSGFTISNFYNTTANYGGAIAMYSAGAVLTNCVLHSNSNFGSGMSGGAVYCKQGTIVDCVISNNYSARQGGGVAIGHVAQLTTTSAVLRRCRILNNNAPLLGGGGGVWANYGALVEDCEISGNVSISGGGLYVQYGSNTVINHCQISSNRATSRGGGAYLSANCTIQQSVITSNSAVTDGGGVYITPSADRNNIEMRGCLIAQNGGKEGLGILLGLAPTNLPYAAVSACTIAGNLAGGVKITSTNLIANYIVDCVIASNSSYQISGTDSNAFLNCAVPGYANFLPGRNNESNNVKFADAANGNYRLQNNSPGRQAGVVLPWMTGAFDLDGRLLIDPLTGKVDMGAYRFVGGRGSVIIIR